MSDQAIIGTIEGDLITPDPAGTVHLVGTARGERCRVLYDPQREPYIIGARRRFRSAADKAKYHVQDVVRETASDAVSHGPVENRGGVPVRPAILDGRQFATNAQVQNGVAQLANAYRVHLRQQAFDFARAWVEARLSETNLRLTPAQRDALPAAVAAELESAGLIPPAS